MHGLQDAVASLNGKGVPEGSIETEPYCHISLFSALFPVVSRRQGFPLFTLTHMSDESACVTWNDWLEGSLPGAVLKLASCSG